MEILLCSLTSIMLRWAVSMGPYSGKGKMPLFGDYEAQRHWQEITLNLPPSEWYMNSTRNDLLYWGLDYPPLTAYHSYVLGMIANKTNPDWVQLEISRGHESYYHKLFMRYSVLVTDILIYLPAFVFYMFQVGPHKGHRDQLTSTFAVFLYPGLILIDYGHFQYNSVSLGFALWSIIAILTNHEIVGSVAFCLALNYKQMELYHAMPIFCFLLGKCFRGKENWFLKVCKLGLAVVISFILCWIPFLTDRLAVSQVLHRLFPFARGLFEDKVANFWCSASVVIKLKEILTKDHLVLLCLGTTLGGLIPSSLHLLYRPSPKNFKLALVNSSLVFFMFSYQVHEKSILLAALPVCLLLPESPVMSIWFLHMSSFSMLPLLIKDGLLLQFIGMSLPFHVISTLLIKAPPHRDKSLITMFKSLVLWLSFSGTVVLVACSVMIEPPSHLPDLWPVLVSAYSAVHFLLFLGYFHYWQLFVK